MPEEIHEFHAYEIRSEYECGFAFSLEYDRSIDIEEASNSQGMPFFAQIKDEALRITLPGMGEGDGMDEMALMFLSSSKYRLTISKSVIESISNVVLQGKESTTNLEFMDLPDIFLVEMPISLLFNSEDNLTLVAK